MSEATTITRGRVGFTPGLWTSWLHSQTMSPASQMWLQIRSVLGSSFTPTEIKLHADERTMQARPGIKRVFCSINPSAGVTAVWIYCPPFKTEAAKQNICGDELETRGTDVTVTHSPSPANFNWTFIFGTSVTLRDPARPASPRNKQAWANPWLQPSWGFYRSVFPKVWQLP